MKISANTKKWITIISMVTLAASQITSPINVKEMLPAQLTNPLIAGLSVVAISAYVILLCAYWVATKQID